LSQEPGKLSELNRGIPPSDLPVAINEIQKLPQLLDEIHHHIEEKAYAS
jgi:hypothetical protein